MVNFKLQPLLSQRNNPGTNYTGVWVGPIAVLDIFMKKTLDPTGIRIRIVPTVISSLYSIRSVRRVLCTIVLILFRNLRYSDYFVDKNSSV